MILRRATCAPLLHRIFLVWGKRRLPQVAVFTKVNTTGAQPIRDPATGLGAEGDAAGGTQVPSRYICSPIGFSSCVANPPPISLER